MSRRERHESRKRERIDFIPWPTPPIRNSLIGDSIGHGISNMAYFAYLQSRRAVPPGRDHLTEELVDYIARGR